MGKILIVDDSEVARMKVIGFLEELNHEIIEASDGMEGIRVADEHSDIQLIISDYNMPEMNGLAMIEKIKEKPAHKDTFFAVMTTETSANLKQKGKSIGVKLWIKKPVNKEAFLKVVKVIFERLGAA